MTLYDKIYRLCKQREINLAQLERVIGISRGAIGKWRKVHPSADTIKKLAQYFGVSADYLLGLAEIPYPDETIFASDPGIISIFRARQNMCEADRNRMNQILRMIFEASFEDK